MTSRADDASTAPPAESLHCPLCEYDLRATTEPRCPECGYTFDWQELRDPSRRLHEYLFEHHPERNVSSFVQTLFSGLNPGRFWSKLYPTQPSRPRRLAAYWLLAALACVVLLAACTVRVVLTHDREYRTQGKLFLARFDSADSNFKQYVLLNHGSAEAYAAAQYPHWSDASFIRFVLRDPNLFVVAVNVVLWLTWPWITLAGMLVFQITMRRARIRSIHVLRCVLYTGDIGLWWALGAGLILIIDFARYGIGRPIWGASVFLPYLFMLSLIMLLFATFRLAFSIRNYLRFRHAFMTAILTQIIVVLVIAKLALDWDYLFR